MKTLVEELAYAMLCCQPGSDMRVLLARSVARIKELEACDPPKPKRIEGIIAVWTPPEGQTIISVTKWQDALVIATSGGLWIKRDTVMGVEPVELQAL